MDLEDRIAAFEKLGNYLSAIDEAPLLDLVQKARNENPWFTEESIRTALEGVRAFLRGDVLSAWTADYRLNPGRAKAVAVVMAGNIPLVGFHDFLAVLISGHSLQVKLSSKDSVLLPHLAEVLVRLEPALKGRISFRDRLGEFDAVIATGSDNSARYFQYYFGKYPSIIRKNRTSCAVLSGNETAEELQELGRDVFTYYGLGCRNVSKLFLPPSFHIPDLFERWKPYSRVIHHHKYHNNYDYQKSILLVNKIPFFDSGFVLMQESEKLVSPISVLYYEHYDDAGSLALKLTESREKIQCVVGKTTPSAVPFGQAQFPAVWDYADRVDTLKFLEALN